MRGQRFYIVHVQDGNPHLITLDAANAGLALEESVKFTGDKDFTQTVMVFDRPPVFVYHGRKDGV